MRIANKRRFMRREAVVWSIITGLSTWLTFRMWRIAIRDKHDLEARRINGFTEVAAHAAVRREGTRCVAQATMFVLGIIALADPVPTSIDPESFVKVMTPYGLAASEALLLVNSMLDLYDRRKALAHVIDTPGWRRGWRGLVSVIWTTEGD